MVSRSGLVNILLDATSSKKISESGSQKEAFSPVTGNHFDMTSKDLL